MRAAVVLSPVSLAISSHPPFSAGFCFPAIRPESPLRNNIQGDSTRHALGSKLSRTNPFRLSTLTFHLLPHLRVGSLYNWLTSRGAGILLHPTSLPGDTGIGTIGQWARRFIDFLAAVGMQYWQVCPLGPTGYGDSPYQCFSAFAGNPYLIDLDEFKNEGLLQESDLEPLRTLAIDYVDYGAQWELRWRVLQKAYSNFSETASGSSRDAFLKFRDVNSDWLKSYANQRGVSIFGDLPIFVAMDSADVWTHPFLFQMDAELRPTGIAGVPPDYFAAGGQRWGNPLYAWERHATDEYAWWCARLEKSFELYDEVRIDHFRGFDQYCRIPPKAENASEYTWEPGPSLQFFETVRRRFPDAKLVAEDLGMITDSVRRLVHEAGLPGMKVLQFGFEGATEYLPHSAIPYSVLYPGTHDNDTSWGWFKNQPEPVKQYFAQYLRTDAKDVSWEMIHAGYASASRIFVAPLQDFLGLGSEARMNTPGQAIGNWRWRFTLEQFDRLWAEQAQPLRDLSRLYQR